MSNNNIIKAIKEARNLFNKLKNNFSREEKKNIRENFFKKEKEQKVGSTKKHKQVLKNIERYFKNFKNFKKGLEKLQKYQYNVTYSLNYLFNGDNYESIELKSGFDIQYESRGDRGANLLPAEYLDIIS